MEIRNNSNVNFQAKMSLADDLAKNLRLQKIAKEFEERTAKKYPQYEIQLRRWEGSRNQDKVSIAIDRGISDDLTMREHVLNERGFEKLMTLSDNKIIQKLTKLLGIVKKRDQFLDSFENDVAKLEKKYGVEIDPDSSFTIYKESLEQIQTENLKQISKDPILSEYAEGYNIFN